jgi:hypothetical protein
MPNSEQDGVLAAIRRFPTRRSAIEALVIRNENFRDMCEELAIAESALSTIDQLDERVRNERRLEWLGCIRRLLKEMEDELPGMNVIPINRHHKRDG